MHNVYCVRKRLTTVDIVRFTSYQVAQNYIDKYLDNNYYITSYCVFDSINDYNQFKVDEIFGYQIDRD